MNTIHKLFSGKKQISPMQVGGFLLIIMGALALADLNLLTGQVGYYVLPFTGLVILSAGLKSRKLNLFGPGAIILGTGLGVVLAHGYFPGNTKAQIGLLACGIGAGWILLALEGIFVFKTPVGWALIPGTFFIGLAFSFLFSQLRIYDFVFYLLIWLGLGLLAWGIIVKLFGLILAGCISITVGSGIFFGWGFHPQNNGLAQTGIMLIWFAVGWALVVIISRLVHEKLIWWPLIPCGILAVVGWGLYLGGGAVSGTKVIGNSGSLMLIIFGIYLLLLRKGIQK